MAHKKPRRYNCKGWDLLTDAEKDPDSNCITQQEYEEALAAARHRRCVSGIPAHRRSWLSQVHISHCPAEEAEGGG